MGYRNLAAVTVPGYTNSSGSNLVKVKCMISGVESTLPDSICALHILPPQTSSPRLLRMLKLQSEDLHSPRNGLLLAYGIEQAFQQLEVSFVRKPDPNSAKNVFVMKVWGAASKHCTTRPLFKTSKLLKVSDYDNAELKLNFVDDRSGCHNPFLRALAYQAFQAYRKWKHLENNVCMCVSVDVRCMYMPCTNVYLELYECTYVTFVCVYIYLCMYVCKCGWYNGVII